MRSVGRAHHPVQTYTAPLAILDVLQAVAQDVKEQKAEKPQTQPGEQGLRVRHCVCFSTLAYAIGCAGAETEMAVKPQFIRDRQAHAWGVRVCK